MASRVLQLEIFYGGLLILFLFRVSTAMKTGCPKKCGNLSISYPFGIGKECSLSKSFALTCNRSTNSAYLDYFNSHVLDISNDKVRINMSSLIVHPKFNKTSGEASISGITFDMMPNYALYRARNKLVVLACDVYASIVDQENENVVAGCASFCNDSSNIHPSFSSSSCTGVGCCHTIIPITNFIIQVHSVNTYTRSWASNGTCYDYFVVEKDFSRFTIPPNISASCERDDDDFTEYDLPLILEWAIENTTCKHASKIKGYVCRQNTDCVDADGFRGYRCRCKPGYQGNPYLHNGCKDVNECSTKSRNNCPENTYCVNTAGGYLCKATEQKRPRFIPIYLGAGTALILLILIGICLWLNREHKKRMDKRAKQKFFKRNGGLLLQHHISSSTSGTAPAIKLFSRQDLEKATDNFNQSRFLGKGGLGTVYKGMLSDGSIVAVKKSNIVDENQVGQFINEVFILSHISHRNIVKLLGCCLETEVPLLVYEYISNGTLSYHLRDEPNISTLSWENRLRIAAEVAGALAYLHSSVATAIFHRDIKSSNILLDENYRALISDFGLSRSVPINKTHLTTLVGGTFGYLDPEYFRSGQLNDKSDVYAFGVVLAELLTGREAISSKTDLGLVHHFLSAIKENNIFKVIDKRIASDVQDTEILALAMIAKRCIKFTARKRPCMKEVASDLDVLIRSRIKEDTVLCNQASLSSRYSINESCSSSYTDDIVAADIDRESN